MQAAAEAEAAAAAAAADVLGPLVTVDVVTAADDAAAAASAAAAADVLGLGGASLCGVGVTQSAVLLPLVTTSRLRSKESARSCPWTDWLTSTMTESLSIVVSHMFDSESSM